MDVSKIAATNPEELCGNGLVDEVVHATGLPGDQMKKELNEILATAGLETQNLTLDELRVAMLAYLEKFAPK